MGEQTETKKKADTVESDTKVKAVVKLIKEYDTANTKMQWVIGDKLVEATEPYARERELDKSLKYISEQTQIDMTTLATWRYISQKYGALQRFPNLSWYHHKEVANIDNPEVWLRKAETNGWSTRRLQLELAKSKNPDFALKPKEPEQITAELETTEDTEDTEEPEPQNEEEYTYSHFIVSLTRCNYYADKVKTLPNKITARHLEELEKQFDALRKQKERIAAMFNEVFGTGLQE
jgi:hypothetical protein